MTIIITGATGLIGAALSQHLAEQGYTVHVLSRKPALAKQKLSFCSSFLWKNASCEPDPQAFPKDSPYGIIHLAGQSLSQWPWTQKRKNEIYNSRILGTQNLKKAISRLQNKPQFFMSASATGIYGDQGSLKINEFFNIPNYNLFLQKVCKDWEEEATSMQSFCPVTILRFGFVLTKKGGFLKQQLLMSRFFVPLLLWSKPIAISWIHLDDLLRSFVWLIQKKSQGIYNLSSPQPTTFQQFFNELAKFQNKKYFRIPTSILLINFFMREMANNLLISCSAVSKKLQQEGFVFQYQDIASVFKKEKD